MDKPSIFIASSVGSLPIARAIESNLRHDAEITVWPEGAFELSKSTLESLLNIIGGMEFGIFVFGPDDVLKWQGDAYKVVRDNVLFELGLFMGKLGRERNFIVMPEGMTDFHLPTDLIGVTPTKYNASRKDGNVRAALSASCDDIRIAVGEIRRRYPEQPIHREPPLRERTLISQEVEEARILDVLGKWVTGIFDTHISRNKLERGQAFLTCVDFAMVDEKLELPHDSAIRFLHRAVIDKGLPYKSMEISNMGKELAITFFKPL